MFIDDSYPQIINEAYKRIVYLMLIWIQYN